MRLLLIARCPPYPLHWGDRLIVYHLVERLAGRGHRIDLLAFYDQPDDPDQIGQYAPLFGRVRLIPEPKRGGLAYLQRMARGMFPAEARAAWSPAMWQAIESACAETAYDVIHLFGGVQVYEYRALAQARPNLITPYESYSLFLSRALAGGRSRPRRDRLALRLQRMAARAFERRMFSGYGRVVVLTEPDAAALRALNPAYRLAVVPNGIDLARFQPQPAQRSAPRLIFTGNFTYGPNVDAALYLGREVFPRIRAAMPEASLQLAGSAPPPDLQALAGAGIEVTGHVPDMPAMLDQAAVYVCPLRYGAGIKNKVLEAMAMALPLVATPLSADGIPLIEGEHVRFAETPETIAAAAVDLLRDAPRRAAMGAASRALIESRFTWDAVADQYEALYRAVRAEARS